MTEALRMAPGIYNGETPMRPNPQFEIPFHLRKSTLKQIRRENGTLPESFWEERATSVEKRGAAIVGSQTEVISEVVINPKYTKGSDIVMTTKPLEGVGIVKIRGEIKSSSLMIQQFKNKVRSQFPELFPTENENGQLIGTWVNNIIFSEWLTNNQLILMNCSEHKAEKEILDESFYPQLKRILEATRRNKAIEQSVQVFPEPTGPSAETISISTSEQLQFFP